jgi:metal-responsive CopG/Arc/MetJ family transcriptional regulator
MALSRAKRATTIILDAETDRLFDEAAHEAGTSRSEFIRMQLRRVLLQYVEHPKPRSAGVVKKQLAERGDEAELFARLKR